MAVIIGMHTKKLLFLGVRNKYCSTCSIAKTSGTEIPKHVCFLNWNGSSPAMETDIVVEEFRQRVHMVCGICILLEMATAQF